MPARPTSILVGWGSSNACTYTCMHACICMCKMFIHPRMHAHTYMNAYAYARIHLYSDMKIIRIKASDLYKYIQVKEVCSMRI